MHLSEKLFWLLFAAYVLGVFLGIGSRLIYAEDDLLLPVIPSSLAITFVHIYAAVDDRHDVVYDLWCALLIWIYFPLCVAFGFFDCAMGIEEGIVRLSNFSLQPFSLIVLLGESLLILLTVKITIDFLRARAVDRETSVLTFWKRSCLVQLLFGPLVVFGFLNAS